MFGIGFTELAIILVIALIAIGPEKLPDIMKVLGKAFGEFKKATEELKKTVDETTEEVKEVSGEFEIEEVMKLEEEKPEGGKEKGKSAAATPPTAAEKKAMAGDKDKTGSSGKES